MCALFEPGIRDGKNFLLQKIEILCMIKCGLQEISTSKIELTMKRNLCFHYFQGDQKSAPKGSTIEHKSTPKPLKSDHRKLQKKCCGFSVEKVAKKHPKAPPKVISNLFQIIKTRGLLSLSVKGTPGTQIVPQGAEMDPPGIANHRFGHQK